MGIQNSLYRTTALEDWVTNFYIRLRILHPKQINIESIAKMNDIFIHHKPLPSDHKVIGRYRGITIDTRKPKELQREIFFHELCHILRHCGVQSMMKAAFREMQERDARHFTRYAAIPYHMIRFIDLDDPYVIDQMVDNFKVTPELCLERLEQIKSRSSKNGTI
jgi:hypothetical protein